MSTILTVVFALFLLVAFAIDPLVAIGLGLLGMLSFARVGELERRIRALQTDAAHAEPTAAAPAPAPAPKPAVTKQAESAALATPATQLADGAYWTPARRRAAKQASSGMFTDRPAAARTDWRSSMWDRWRAASAGELEELIAGRLLAVVGGVALLIGGIFFLGLAFSRGWIGPEMRIVIGIVAGVGLFGLGGWLMRGGRQIVAHVLVAVGIGVFTLAFFAATRLYGFLAPELGVGAALVASAAAAVLAVQRNSQVVTVFGLVAVLASPPVMGAGTTLLTLAFIGAALVGTTAIALFRSWLWLPPIAFLLSVPQLAVYLDSDPPLALALGTLGGFWLLNAVAAAGEEIRTRRNRLAPTSATLLLATAAFTVASGFGVLDGDLMPLRGIFLLVLAIAHLALAAVFLIRESDRHPFGMLVAGTGIAAVTMAVPIQLGAQWVPLAWAAEAVALAWIYVERSHRYSGIVAAILGALAAVHIAVLEYPPDRIGFGVLDGIPFANPSGLALGFVVVAAGAAVWLLRSRHERIAVAGVAAMLVALAIPHELRGWPQVAALTALGTVLLVAQGRWLGIPLRAPEAPRSTAQRVVQVAERAMYVSAVVVALYLLTAFEQAVPLGDVAAGLASTAVPERLPFVNTATLAALIVAAGTLATGVANAGRWLTAGILAAAAVIAYLMPAQVGGAFAIVGWAAMAVALVSGVLPADRLLRRGAMVLAGAAVIETPFVAARPDNLWVRAGAPGETAILNAGILATLAVAAMFAARAMLPPRDRERRYAGIGAAIAVVYAASIALVDVFQVQVGVASQPRSSRSRRRSP